MKKRNIFYQILILTLLTLVPLLSQSQQDTTFYNIETTDGNEYIGQIIFEDETIITLRTRSLGDIDIKKSLIKSRVAIKKEQIIVGEYWFDNPQSTRHFWQPNGYGLKSGEGYYQNIWLLFNQFSFGVTDEFTLGVGFVPLFLFAGSSSPVWITPKISFPVVENKLNIGGGALLGTILGSEGDPFGIAYGLTTFGKKDANVTLGIGYGFSGGDWADLPTITFSGIYRVGKRGYLITENYFIGTGGENNVALFSIGGRSLIKKVGLDYGLFFPANTGEFNFALPLLGLTVPFDQSGKTRAKDF